jgi:hypothetical protein
MGDGALLAGTFADFKLPQMQATVPGKHSPQDWGIDRICFRVEGSNLYVYQVEMKYVDVGSTHIPELGQTSHGTQTGLDWTEHAAHQVFRPENAVAADTRRELETALRRIGVTPDAATMERVLMRKLPKAKVFILTPFYAPLSRLQAQVRGLISHGRQMIIVPARPLFGPRGGRL